MAGLEIVTDVEGERISVAGSHGSADVPLAAERVRLARNHGPDVAFALLAGAANGSGLAILEAAASRRESIRIDGHPVPNDLLRWALSRPRTA
jgi:hypothetical protein